MTETPSATWSLAAIAGIVLAYIALETWRPHRLPPAIAFTAAGLLAGRLPVAIATLGTRSSRATVAYLGCFAPRGLASIVFAVIVVEAETPHSSTIVDAAALTVAASLVLHGLTAGPLTERYVRGLTKRRRPRTGVVQPGGERA
jgi:NhaP-type Na+/H+ or K+/H+ antiporter